MKKYLLLKLSQAMIRYLNLLIRHDCTTKHRGEDPVLDDSIRFISLSKVYGLSLEDMNISHYDENTISKLETALTSETNQILAKFKTDYALYISSIKALTVNEKAMLPKMSWYRIIRLILEIKRKSIKIYNYFRELHRVKLTLSSELIGTFFAVITPTIILGSLLRQYLFSIAFNFPMGLVYSFDDYLSASISTVIAIIIPILIACVVSAIIIISDRGHDPINNSFNAKGSVRDLNIISIVIIVLLIILFIKRREDIYIYAPVLVFILFLQPLTTFLVKNFTNGRSIFFYTMVIFIFFSGIYSATQNEIKQLKEASYKYDVSIFGTEDNNLYKGFAIITYGSRNIVLYNRSTSEILLLKPEEIKKMHILNEK